MIETKRYLVNSVDYNGLEVSVVMILTETEFYQIRNKLQYEKKHYEIREIPENTYTHLYVIESGEALMERAIQSLATKTETE